MLLPTTPVWPSYWTAKERQCANALAVMAQQWDAERLFLAAIADNALRPVELATEGDYGPLTVTAEILAFCLSPFFGHAPTPTQPITIVQVRQAWQHAEVLLYARQARDIENALRKNEREDEEAQSSRSAVRTVHDFKRVVRSMAYPEQTSRQINEVQGRFDLWFAAHCGVAPQRAVALVWKFSRRGEIVATALVKHCAGVYIGNEELLEDQNLTPSAEQKKQELDEAYLTRLVDGAPDALPCSFEEMEAQLDPPLQKSEWDGFISLLGLTPSMRQTIYDLEEMRRFPVVALGDGRIYFVDLGHTLDVLWEAFDARAKEDQAFYQKYQNRRSAWLEEQTALCLERIFGSQSISRSLLYPNPDKPGDEAELDALALWGNFGVLVECKAKQFRTETQLERHEDGSVGDAGRLASDLAANVVEAFKQAERALRFIEETNEPVFREKATKRLVPIQKAPDGVFYLLTVSLLEQGGIANYRAALQDLGLFPDGISSLSLTIWELDIILGTRHHQPVLRWPRCLFALHQTPSRTATRKLRYIRG